MNIFDLPVQTPGTACRHNFIVLTKLGVVFKHKLKTKLFRLENDH